MTTSSDPDHFFQTTHSLSETTRRAAKSKNTFGNPIRLPSKILAVITDPLPSSPAVYVAESAGNARRIDLDVGALALLLFLYLLLGLKKFRAHCE